MRITILLAAIALSTGCARLKSGAMPSMADVQAAKAKLSKTQADAEAAQAKCPPEDGNIPIQEEREIGGALMVQLAHDNGTFLFEGELPPVTAGKEYVAPKNAKNNVTAYVGKVGRLLASYSSRPELPWTFGVIENDGINAFSTPGGYVVITTGLMRLIDNEAQLAAVIGHEIGHVTHKHLVKTYAGVKRKICLPAVTAAVYIQAGLNNVLPAEVMAQADFAGEFTKPNLDPTKTGFIDALTSGVLNVRKLFGAGKDNEFEADTTGFELMMFAGYDTNEFDKVIRKAEQGGKSFDSHPGNVDRLKHFTALRKDPKDCTETEGDWVKECGTYGAFASGGVAPPVPADVIAALPAEGTAKPPVAAAAAAAPAGEVKKEEPKK